MTKLISVKLAGNILLILFILLAVFHILVLLGLIPSDIVWGGQVADSSMNRVLLEIMALLVTLVFILVVAAKIGYVRFVRFPKVITVGLWIIFIYMLLNTLGNLASPVSAEKWIFMPLTFIIAILALKLALEK